MTTIQLTATQRQVLDHAADQPDGRLAWFPDSVKGGARQKVLTGLLTRALITTDGSDSFIAAAGYDALGRARPTPAPVEPAPPSGPPKRRRWPALRQRPQRPRISSQSRRQTAHPRAQQTGHRHPDAAAAGGRDHRADLRTPDGKATPCAAPSPARSRRSSASPAVGQAGGRRAGVSDCMIGARCLTCHPNMLPAQDASPLLRPRRSIRCRRQSIEWRSSPTPIAQR